MTLTSAEESTLKYKWEEVMEEGGFTLIERLGGPKILVSDGTFEYVTYTTVFSNGRHPTLASCTDKTKLFLHKNKDKLNKDLDYSEFEYTGSASKATVVCKIHGKVSITIGALVLGAGCYLCGREAGRLKMLHNHEENLKSARKVHGDKYEYFDLNKSSREFVEIKCPEHGVFKQKLTSHLQGCGCKECARFSQSRFNRSSFEKYSTYYLYVMRMWNEDSGEDFIKIGISHNPQSRCRQFNNKSGGVYSAEILYTYQTDGVGAWDLEKLLLKEFRDFRYIPRNAFNGSTECFSSVCLDSIKKIAQCCA